MRQNDVLRKILDTVEIDRNKIRFTFFQMMSPVKFHDEMSIDHSGTIHPLENNPITLSLEKIKGKGVITRKQKYIIASAIFATFTLGFVILYVFLPTLTQYVQQQFDQELTGFLGRKKPD